MHKYIFKNLIDFWLIFFLPDCGIIKGGGEGHKTIMLSQLKKWMCNFSSSWFLLFHGFLIHKILTLCRGWGTMKMSLRWGNLCVCGSSEAGILWSFLLCTWGIAHKHLLIDMWEVFLMGDLLYDSPLFFLTVGFF